MKKIDLLSIYFALNTPFGRIAKIKKEIQRGYEIAKFNKHKGAGKTTSHRKPKSKKEIGTHEKRKQSIIINNIILFYEASKKNPTIQEQLEDVDIKRLLGKFDSIESFVYNYY